MSFSTLRGKVQKGTWIGGNHFVVGGIRKTTLMSVSKMRESGCQHSYFDVLMATLALVPKVQPSTRSALRFLETYF